MKVINDDFDIKNSKEEERYKRAKVKIKKIKSFYKHLLVYIVINTYIAIKAFIDHGFEGIAYSLMGFGFFWGIGLFFHWFSVFGKNLLYSKDWEEKKIKDLMNKDN